jgi:signal transduction histidine kinase
MRALATKISRLEKKIRHLGHTSSLVDHEKRKLGIFNQMNLSFGLILGVLIPMMAWLRGSRFPLYGWCCMSLGPLVISAIIAACVGKGYLEQARVGFFFLHPLLLAGIHALKLDTGNDLFYVCFGVLSVFFLESVYNIIFSFSLSMTCYFIAHSLGSATIMDSPGYGLPMFNHLIAIFFIFYGIFLVRNENDRYQLQITNKNNHLQNSYIKIRAQEKELSERAGLLEEQSLQLQELNSLKNKLFSVIAHDLRGPLHALHNIFRNMERYDLPGEEIKMLIPDLAKELAHTTVHIENLLQWAQSQMHAEAIRPQVLDVSEIIKEVLGFLHLQAEAKQLHIETRISGAVNVRADHGMINLVLRNLLSNAIKFTPEGGKITLGVKEAPSYVEISVHDTGTGISPENLKKITEGTGYTKTGTANEPGSGLGLMLCREFLARNGGRLDIRSKPGEGSVFSFTLPKAG